MKKITLLLSGILSCLFSFAQTPQLVSGNYQQNVQPNTLGSLGECAGLGNALVFVANNNLWITDGSVNGTTLLKAFAQLDSIKPVGLKKFNDKIYFFADDGIHGYELWSTDGTTTGTTLIKDINPGSGSSIRLEHIQAHAFRIHTIEIFDGHLYFAADDDVHGSELWKSDGTEQGTEMFDDLNPGPDDGITNLRQIVAAGNKLYFIAEKPDPIFVGLYATNGTVNGTTLCLDTFASLINESILPYGNKIIFSVGINLSDTYISDGTETGTFIIVPGKQNPRDIAVLNGKAYFFVAHDPVGYVGELMETDGTIQGTNSVYDSIGGGILNYETLKTFYIQELNGALYFSAWKYGISGIWKSDGTDAGTFMISDLDVYTSAYHLTQFNGKIYFKADNAAKHELGYSDGTPGGTQMFNVPANITNQGNIIFARKYYRYPMVSTGNALYFYNIYDENTGPRIYKLDQFPANVGQTPEVSSIDIYPNPSQGFITVDAENAKNISIHSIDGKLVYQNQQIRSNRQTVDTHNLAPGTYTITTLLTDGTKSYGKFVKQ